MFINGIIYGGRNFIIFALLVLFRRLVNKEGIKSFWLHGDKRGMRLLSEGLLVGLLCFAVYPIGILLTGSGSLETHGGTLVNSIGLMATAFFSFASVALLEEALYRGYIMQKLLKVCPAYAAAAISSVIFAIWHGFLYSTSGAYMWLGVLNAFILGMILCFINISTKSIMSTIGLHFAWNFAEAILFAKQNFNIDIFMNLKVKGGLLAGFTDMPETGLLIMVVLALIFAYYKFIAKKAFYGVPDTE